MPSLRLKLAKLIAGNPIVVSETGNPTGEFLRYQNDQNTNIENISNDTAQNVDNITYALQQINVIILTQAQIVKDQALIGSYVNPFHVLSAVVETATPVVHASITIVDHTRIYGDGSQVAVNGGVLTGLALETAYYVYYVDLDHVGGFVAYIATTTKNAAGQGNGRHFVGSVYTPRADATDPVMGRGATAPGVPTTDPSSADLPDEPVAPPDPTGGS